MTLRRLRYGRFGTIVPPFGDLGRHSHWHPVNGDTDVHGSCRIGTPTDTRLSGLAVYTRRCATTVEQSVVVVPAGIEPATFRV